MKRTYEERLAAGLVADGYREVPSRNKYRKFVREDGKRPLLLGPGGALRLGATVAASSSIGCPGGWQSPYYQTLLALAGPAEVKRGQPMKEFVV